MWQDVQTALALLRTLNVLGGGAMGSSPPVESPETADCPAAVLVCPAADTGEAAAIQMMASPMKIGTAIFDKAFIETPLFGFTLESPLLRLAASPRRLRNAIQPYL